MPPPARDPHLKLRDGLSECLVDALRGSSGETLGALAEFARRTDERGVARQVSRPARERLESAGLFRFDGDTVRLDEPHLPDLGYLKDRAFRFEKAVARFDPSGAEDPLARSLQAASVLFDLELFFELHEILEPLWQKADDPLRTFLQGLIQVAVGFHHEQEGNRRGADKLMRDGLEKLRPFRPEAWGVELREFCAGVEEYRQRRITAGRPSPASRPRLMVPGI